MLTLFPNSLPISIHPLFFLLALMIGWLNAGTLLGTSIWALVIFISVIVHELGHATFGLLYNQSPAITLYGMGGMTERRCPTRLKPWKEFLLVLAGPLFGFALALIAIIALQFVPEKMEMLTYALTVTYIVNIFWTILNLFPIHPMDGGKLSMIILEYFFGIRGIKISLILSCVVGLIFGLLFFYLNQIIVGAFFLLFAFESWRGFRGALGLSQHDESEELKILLKEGDELLALNRRLMAKDKYLQMQEVTKKGQLYAQSEIRLAEIAYADGEYHETLDRIEKLNSYELDVSTLKLKQKALMQLEMNKEALKLGEEIFLHLQDADTAAKNAILSARLRNEKAAIGWLKWLKNNSPDNFKLLSQHVDFDFLRSSQFFKDE